MAESTINMKWVNDESNSRQYYHIVNLSQSQTQQFPHASLPRDCDWRWSEGARPVSTLTWSPTLPSHVLSPAEGSDWNTLSPTTPSNLPISAGVNRLTPNSSLTYCPETTTATSLRQIDYISPGGQYMSFSAQANHKENTIYDNEVYHAAPEARAQPEAYLPLSSQRSRRPQQPRGCPPAQPLQCKWDGCDYPGSFKQESSLIRHLKNVHFSPGAHPCPFPHCDMVFNRKDNLRQHTRNIHASG